MATSGNERYLRYILLLGEGVLLVLRGIVLREVAKTGSTLKTILSLPSNRIQVESNCSSSVQRLQLFPSATTVNDDIYTWDISLLTLVLERVFWSSLTQSERLHIGYLRDCRNALQGHPPAMSMDETFYTTRSSDLSTVLQAMASKIDQETQKELKRVINNSSSVMFDFHSAIQSLQMLYEFKEDMLEELEHRFKEVDTKLDEMLAENKQASSDIAAVQSHMHADVLDIKKQGEESTAVASQILQAVGDVKDDVNKMEQNQQQTQGQMRTQLQGLERAVESSQQDISEIKDLAATPKPLCEEDKTSLKSIEKKLEELLSLNKGNRREIQRDIDTTMDIDSNTQEHSADAQDMVITKINDIIEQIRPDILEKREDINIIKRRVKEIVTEGEGSNYELTLALLELIKDISQHGSIQQVRKGSIQMTVRINSYESLLNYFQYLSSYKFQQSLDDISNALKRRRGHPMSISARIPQENLLDLHSHLVEECEKLRRKKTVVLPVKCKSLEDLNHIWRTLQKGGAAKHMERISEILSEIVGEKTSVTTSVNLEQFEQTLVELSSPHPHSPDLQTETNVATWEPPLNPADHDIPTAAGSLHSKRKKQPELECGLTAEQVPRSSLICKSEAKHTVRDSGDRKTPFIYGFCVIPGGNILLVDKNNKNLKKLDKTYKIASCCGLHSTPCDVCYVGNDRAAVSLSINSLQFVNILGDMYLENAVKLGFNCTGLACHGDILYVTDSSKTVYTYTTDGADKNILYKMQDEHVMIRHVATSDDGEMIYIATKKTGLVTVDKRGRHMATLKSDILSFPNDVCIVGDGTILISDFYSNVLQADYRGEEILGQVVDLLPDLQSSQKVLCYDRAQSKLIVGGLNEYIQVFELQNKTKEPAF